MERLSGPRRKHAAAPVAVVAFTHHWEHPEVARLEVATMNGGDDRRAYGVVVVVVDDAANRGKLAHGSAGTGAGVAVAASGMAEAAT